MISTLDFLYIVLAVMLFPIGTLVSMILWRIYKMMDRMERILDFIDRLVEYGKEIEKIPLAIIDKIIGK
ncbi:hypothetical protein KBD33_01825 [Candidatus Gracilibacteria bacterium]|nr:hypothetical protein [Candidatus Gracilibacteria bacterium]